MAWVYLFVAGLLEIVWAVGLKSSQGFTRPLASVVMLVAMAGSFWLLALALKEIPLGTGYAVWVGIGAVGVAIAGIILLGEAVSVARLIFLAVIIAGIVGLRIVEG